MLATNVYSFSHPGQSLTFSHRAVSSQILFWHYITSIAYRHVSIETLIILEFTFYVFLDILIFFTLFTYVWTTKQHTVERPLPVHRPSYTRSSVPCWIALRCTCRLWFLLFLLLPLFNVCNDFYIYELLIQLTRNTVYSRKILSQVRFLTYIKEIIY